MNAPIVWHTFVSDFSAADDVARKTLASAMRQRVIATSDPELSRRLAEALDDLVTAVTPDDIDTDFLSRLGERHGQLIQGEAYSASTRAEKREQKFSTALDTVDAADKAENAISASFQQDVEKTEAVARDNLAYLESAGYVAAFGQNFDDFLSVVNANRLKIYPNAGAPIAFPSELSEADRALMAHALVLAVGGGVAIEEFFEIPSYRLKSFDASGGRASERIEMGLKNGGIWNEGVFNQAALERRLKGPSALPQA